MHDDDSRHWGLFENRPARERTSQRRAEGARGDGGEPTETKPHPQRIAPRGIVGERIKC